MSDTPLAPNWYQGSDGKWYPPAPPQREKWNGLAIASLVLGIVWLYWVGSILAVIFGHIALSTIKKNPTIRGRGFAIAGVVLGYVWLGFLDVAFIVGFGIGLSEF